MTCCRAATCNSQSPAFLENDKSDSNLTAWRLSANRSTRLQDVLDRCPRGLVCTSNSTTDVISEVATRELNSDNVLLMRESGKGAMKVLEENLFRTCQTIAFTWVENPSFVTFVFKTLYCRLYYQSPTAVSRHIYMLWAVVSSRLVWKQ